MTTRKGIVLAGGAGSRLHPATLAMSKQLLPVYDKPMIYYPLSTLMQANIRDILIITTPQESTRFQQLLGNGDQWGIKLSYATQAQPKGIAEAFIIAESFIANDNCALILGDNIYHGDGLPNLLDNANQQTKGATIFAYHVHDPERYGVVEFDNNNNAISLIEKPKHPKSKYAVTGLYFYDNHVIDIAKSIKPSWRNELEITDINNVYLQQGSLTVQQMGRGFAWLDTGTHESLLEASQFIATLEHRQGLKVGCPEEVAYHQQWINEQQIRALAKPLMQNSYGKYLLNLITAPTK